MIITVTLNAALDRTLVAPGFAAGQSRTVERGLNLGGGKGLNAARALRSLGCPVLALGFAGGLTGEIMRRSLDTEGLPHDLTPIAGESRTCTAIVDPERGVAMEINEPGPAIGKAEIAAFLQSFDRALPKARLVALCGSLPPGLPENFYSLLIERARRSGVDCFLDTRDRALQAGIQAEPLLVKPNRLEAAQILGSAFDPEDGEFVRRALPHPGPTLLALTLGPEGAVLHGPTGAWRARPPIVQPQDTVGAGDSFVGGLAAALVQVAGDAPLAEAVKRPEVLESMLRLATATAVANVLTIGAGLCNPADIARLLKEIEVQRLS